MKRTSCIDTELGSLRNISTKAYTAKRKLCARSTHTCKSFTPA